MGSHICNKIKIKDFYKTCRTLVASLRVIPCECQCQSWIYIMHKRKASNANIRINFIFLKTKMIVVSDTEDRKIVSLFICTKHRNVTDGQTDGPTDLPWLLHLSKHTWLTMLLITMDLSDSARWHIRLHAYSASYSSHAVKNSIIAGRTNPGTDKCPLDKAPLYICHRNKCSRIRLAFSRIRVRTCLCHEL